MTDQTQTFTASPRAFRLWIAAATATLFVIVATVTFMTLAPDFDGWMAALASGFAAAFISGLGGIEGLSPWFRPPQHMDLARPL